MILQAVVSIWNPAVSLLCYYHSLLSKRVGYNKMSFLFVFFLFFFSFLLFLKVLNASHLRNEEGFVGVMTFFKFHISI